MTLPLILTIAFVPLFIISLCHAAKREPLHDRNVPYNLDLSGGVEGRHAPKAVGDCGGSEQNSDAATIRRICERTPTTGTSAPARQLAEAGIDWQSNAVQLPQSLRREIKDKIAARLSNEVHAPGASALGVSLLPICGERDRTAIGGGLLGGAPPIAAEKSSQIGDNSRRPYRVGASRFKSGHAAPFSAARKLLPSASALCWRLEGRSNEVDLFQARTIGRDALRQRGRPFRSQLNPKTYANRIRKIIQDER